MTWDVCTITEPVARKQYECDACEVIHNFGIMESDVTPEEWTAWQKAKNDGYKILKGNKYSKCNGIFEGAPNTFRARPEMNDLCQKYDLY